MSLYPGVCVSGGKNGAGGCPAGTHFEARKPGFKALALVAPTSKAPTPVASHWFTGVDVPMSEELAR